MGYQSHINAINEEARSSFYHHLDQGKSNKEKLQIAAFESNLWSHCLKFKDKVMANFLKTVGTATNHNEPQITEAHNSITINY